MKRVPLVPTLIVGIAVAAMIALGLWQLLDRLPRKEALLAQIEANPARPPIAFPRTSTDTLLFRRSAVACANPIAQSLQGAGAAGYRVIATCPADATGGSAEVQLGTTRDPNYRTPWPGGTVAGFVSHAPSSVSLIGSLFDHTPRAMMLVADRPPPGLAANARPDIGAIPNNHLAYAGQWFFFAIVATIVYLLALRRRG